VQEEEERETLTNMATGEVYVPEGEVSKKVKAKEDQVPYEKIAGVEGES